MLIAVNLIGQTDGQTDAWMRSGFDVQMSIPHPRGPRGSLMHAQFTQAELEVAFAEAAVVGAGVAAHAQEPSGVGPHG